MPRRARFLIVVAFAAILAGVGVASLGGSTTPVNSDASRAASAIVRSISPRSLDLTFNPRTTRGMKVAKAAFRFTYRHAASQRAATRERIESQWNSLVSSVLRVLMRRTPEELKSEEGLDRLADELRRSADAVLFGDGIGAVEEILWQQIIVQ